MSPAVTHGDPGGSHSSPASTFPSPQTGPTIPDGTQSSVGRVTAMVSGPGGEAAGPNWLSMKNGARLLNLGVEVWRTW